MNGMDALSWLALCEEHPTLSADAVALAVAFSDEFTGIGQGIAITSGRATYQAGFTCHGQRTAAEKELREAGLLTGRGWPERRPYRPTTPRARMGGDGE